MDVSSILDTLNAEQRAAVSTPDSRVLVLAGAGSGKTRVLVHRIAWYLAVHAIPSEQILAVTFTNKAAGEMRGRVEKMLDNVSTQMWIGSFHAIAHRILRAQWQAAGYPKDFQIIDSNDQYRCVRRVIRMLELKELQYPPKEVQRFINNRKELGQRGRLSTEDPSALGDMVKIYQHYETYCAQHGLVDFTELLLRVYELFRDEPEILTYYQRRFRYLMVDEFQDTNTLQYAWLRLFAGQENNLFVVGDDDQMVYSWRGAKVENMQQFQDDFSATLVRLEQNYRSSSMILQAANALIEQNSGRLGKKLWTNGEQGEPITLYVAYNERDEASYVAEQIIEYHKQHGRYQDIAILYRVGAQSRVLEKELMLHTIPYRIYGGLRFYERAEIKDALAYLRFVRFFDDISFERIINTPPRGIGQKTLANLRDIARSQGCSLWAATELGIQQKLLPARALTAVFEFLAVINKMRTEIVDLPLYQQVEWIVQNSGLIAYFREDKYDKNPARLENLDELINAAKEFSDLPNIPEEMDDLQAFLAHTSLDSGEMQADPHSDFVHLMTLHSAKGLEFPVVYILGLEDGLLPHQRSKESPKQLEEERRLCYVGITRAKQKLILTRAEHRYMSGSDQTTIPSRFLSELPKELIEEVRLTNYSPVGSTTNTTISTNNDDNQFSLGQRVMHTSFGEGVILNIEGQREQIRLQVNFQIGSKWLVASYAKLKVIT